MKGSGVCFLPRSLVTADTVIYQCLYYIPDYKTLSEDQHMRTIEYLLKNDYFCTLCVQPTSFIYYGTK